MGTHRELSKRSLRAKKRPVRAKNGQLERKKGQFERKNGQVERKSAFEVPSGLPKNFKSARRRQLRASKSVMRAAKGRRSPKPPKPSSVISRWIFGDGGLPMHKQKLEMIAHASAINSVEKLSKSELPLRISGRVKFFRKQIHFPGLRTT